LQGAAAQKGAWRLRIVEGRFVGVAFEMVGDEGPRNAAIAFDQARMAADPIRQRLAPSRLGMLSLRALSAATTISAFRTAPILGSTVDAFLPAWWSANAQREEWGAPAVGFWRIDGEGRRSKPRCGSQKREEPSLSGWTCRRSSQSADGAPPGRFSRPSLFGLPGGGQASPAFLARFGSPWIALRAPPTGAQCHARCSHDG
jgi:hypothetical protein